MFKKGLGLILLFILAIPASATILQFDMTYIYSGTGVPTNSPPWLRATFDDGGSSGSVLLTITPLSLTADERIGKVYFNLNPSIDPTQLVFSAPTKIGAFDNPVISKGINCYKADGDGKYDIRLQFTEDGESLSFNGGESIQYMITYAGLTANSFDFLSSPAGGTGPFKVAAHIQSLNCTNDSAWITIPEPATITLLGLSSLVVLRRKKTA